MTEFPDFFARQPETDAEEIMGAEPRPEFPRFPVAFLENVTLKPFEKIVNKESASSRELVSSLNELTTNVALRASGIDPPLMEAAELYNLLSPSQIELVEAVVQLNPYNYGIEDPYKGLEPIPTEVTIVNGQVIEYGGETKNFDPQYVPNQVFEAYSELRQACQADTGEDILIGSAYRSPVYQAIILLRWLEEYKFDLEKTLRYVSVPGRSPHGSSKQPAVDFMSKDGIWLFDAYEFKSRDPKDTPKFDDLVIYPWLQERAHEFGFIMTCPKDNAQGLAYEPWHWEFIGKPD
jgi:LAS superfamily LD-carboxypeptidase LdcB